MRKFVGFGIFYDWYSTFILRYHKLVVCLFIFLSITVPIVSYFICKIPAIDDIREEFVVRGTKSSGKNLQFRNLRSLNTHQTEFEKRNDTKENIRQKRSIHEIEYDNIGKENHNSKTCSDYLFSFKNSKRIIIKTNVLTSKTQSQFSTYGEILNLCKIENEIKATCSENCVTVITKAEAYRRILGKSTCNQINKDDVALANRIIHNFTEKLLDKTYTYFNSTIECWIMRFLYYIVPLKSSDTIQMDYPGYSMLYFDFIEMEMYKISSIYNILQKNDFKIVGTKTQNENEVVEEILRKDLRKEVYVLIVILVLLYFCGQSIIITIFTVFIMINSMLISYMIYFHVLMISNFPFINFLNFIILLALGTDDIFIYTLKWNRISTLKIDENLKILKTIESSLSTIFATSFSTTLSLLFCFTSSIVAIKCFACYGALLISIHFILIFIFLPPISYISASKPQKSRLNFQKNCQKFYIDKVTDFIVSKTIEFHKVIFSFGLLLFIFAIFSLLVYPKLIYPKHLKNDILRQSHPFLHYDAIKYRFTFERNPFIVRENKWVVSFVWGILPEDNRSWLNLQEYSPILLDRNFEMSNFETVKWLRDFCLIINSNLLTPDEIKPYIQQRRIEGLSNCPFDGGMMSLQNFIDLSNCSSQTKFHMKVKNCLNKFTESDNLLNNFQFHYQNERMVGLIIDFNLDIKPNETYQNIVRKFSSVENWFENIIKTSPKHLENGMTVFQSEYDRIYMLYSAIAEYLPFSFSVAFVSAGFVGVILIWNGLITGIMLFVLLVILCLSIATLTWFDWNIGIIEAAIFTVATGLGIDFCLHFAVIYHKRRIKSTNVCNSIEKALSDVFWPVILTAITTCLPGLPLINSCLLIFNRLGLFLFVITFWSIVSVLLFFPACVLLKDLSMLKLQNSVDRYQIDKV